MGNFTSKHRWGVVVAWVLTVLSHWGRAQSGSFGSTFAHSTAETAIYEQHNFVTGSGTINAGIIGSERQQPIGVYSFINPNGTWISASQTAFVDGYVRTYQSGPFTFPIGDNDRYRPAAVSASASANPTTAAYYGVDPGLATTSNLMGGTYGILPAGGPAFPTTSKAANVGTVDNVEYWDIDGNTPARITLTWDANTPITSMVGTDLSRLRIVGWNGTQWVIIPSTFDASSLVQTTSASLFTGPASTVSAGSITTDATVVPGSYVVYTLAGICTVTQVTASVSSLTTCSGEPVSISYTTAPTPGGQVQWVRRASDGSEDMPGIGDITDYPTATGNTPVSYTYTASSSDITGCTSNTVTTEVTVNPIPTVTPSACAQTICSGQTGSIIFQPSITGSIVHWIRTPDTPAPSSGTGDIAQTLINTGPTSLTYTYKIWAESPAPASCMSTDTITCIIVVTPGLNVSAVVASGSGCIGQPLSLSASVSSTGTYTYSWTGPNGYVGSGPNPLVTSSAAVTHNGNYTLVVSDVAGCSGTAIVPVSVTYCCNLTATAGSNSPQCTGNDLQLTASVQGGSGSFSYNWTGPNGFSSTQQNPTIANSTSAVAGSYTVVVTDLSVPNCSSMATTNVTIATTPSLTITSSGGMTVCSGQSTSLSVGGSNGATVTWTNNLGQSGTGTAINFAGLTNVSGLPQTIVYTFLAQAGSCSDQEVVTITVNPAPALQVVPTRAVVCELEEIYLRATARPSTATVTWSRDVPVPTPSGNSGQGSVEVKDQLPAGTYNYTFQAMGTNGCNSPQVVVPVVVNN
ncbi:hypothetical protein ACO2Q8_26830 [Larkinella sp. VNQ87]|uniref:hypothetical protein n=1 Tax=Larkinella sp. VNQ87 TaxID=3400921 RepID=UPI003C103FAF